jgi:hypothetical protein
VLAGELPRAFGVAGEHGFHDGLVLLARGRPQPLGIRFGREPEVHPAGEIAAELGEMLVACRGGDRVMQRAVGEPRR